MKTFFVVFILSAIAMEPFSSNRTSDRMPVAAGRFYSSDRETLIKDLAGLFASRVSSESSLPRAIISPHAGYVFSGKIAAAAFSSVPAGSEIENIFIIASSHVMAFDGASVYFSGDYITPLGKVRVNRTIAEKLRNENRVFRFPETSHIQEHSIEVQLPFIQYHIQDDPLIVPVIIGTDNRNTIKEIAEALRPWFTEKNLFVISSDFSHYPSYEDAKVIDGQMAEAIMTKDPEQFLSVKRKTESSGTGGLATAMCGWTSGLTMLYLIEKDPRYIIKKIDYSNSGDSKYGDREGVVGYNALVVLSGYERRKSDQGTGSDVSFTDKERDLLFSIARNSIKGMLFDQKRYTPDPETIPESLKQKMGAFVTLKTEGELRGCIGRFPSNDPLYEVVGQMAIASAFEDSRFSPLSRYEYGKLEIEISVLGPLRRISSISEIIPGRHGIYIKKDFRSGTMLPQVAVENGWTTEQFLGYTSRDKAGLGWEGWKNAELSVYDTVVLQEKD